MRDTQNANAGAATIPGPVSRPFHPSPAADLIDAITVCRSFPDTRTDRVEEMRARMARGQWNVSSAQIADAILRSTER